MMKMNLRFILFFSAWKIMAADFPTIHGQYRMNNEWTVNLPVDFRKRFEDGNLVLWRPGLTFWIMMWGNDKNEAMDLRLKNIKEASSPEKRSENVEKNAKQILYTYELIEHDEEREAKDYLAIYAYEINKDGHVQVSAYADSEKDKRMAYEIIRSIEHKLGNRKD